MRIATITEAKNRLSALIDEVKAGETVLITDRGVPVARLEPAAAVSGDDSGRLDRLERAGIIRRGTGEFPLDLIRKDPPRPSNNASIVEAVLEERREGR